MKLLSKTLIPLLILGLFITSVNVAKPVSGVTVSWINRFSKQVDYGNGTFSTACNIGPATFWNNQTNSWQELLFENHTDAANPYYLVRNAHVTAKIGYSARLDQMGVLYYDPDYREKRAAEFWNVQVYSGSNWVNITKAYYSHTVFQSEALINVTVIFECKLGALRIGWLGISYILQPQCFLKHQVVYKSVASTAAEYRCILTLLGIAGEKVIDRLGDHAVTLNETVLESQWLRFVNASNPAFQFFEEKLDSLGHYLENGTWTNDYVRGVRLKLESYEEKQLVRCDIAIGNYTLGLDQHLEIDPTSSTWQVGASTDDAEAYEAYTDHPPWDTLSTTSITNRIGYYSAKYYGHGLRFLSIGIPNAATINNAVVEYNASSDLSGSTVNARIACQDADTTATFSTVADYNGRSRTAYTSWGGVSGWAKYSKYNSTDFAARVQTVVNRAGWASGNSIVVFVEDDGTSTDLRQAYAYDGPVSGQAPKLYVTWSTGETNPPTYTLPSPSYNTTNAGWVCLFSCQWTDDTGVSIVFFQSNYTGTNTNYTVTLTSGWANYTHTLNSNVGYVESYKWIANDTYNNWNLTMPFQNITMTFYSSLNVVTTTHSWNINPGQTDVAINEGTISVTVTANANFNIQIEGSGALSDGNGHSIALSNIKVHKDTLGSAISLTTGWQNIPGLTNQAAGTDLSKTFVLWASCPSPCWAATYTYSITVQVVQT